jgi:hypothetical protein
MARDKTFGTAIESQRDVIATLLSRLIWQRRRLRGELFVEAFAALVASIAGALGRGSSPRLIVATLAFACTWLACRDVLRLRTLQVQIEALTRLMTATAPCRR